MLRTISLWALWPLSVTGYVAALLLFANPTDPGSLFGVMGRTAFVSTMILLALEVVVPFRKDWRWRGDRDWLRDIGHLALYGQVGGLLTQLLFLRGLAGVLEPLDLPTVWPASAPLILQILLVMVLGDALEYWLHRLSHTLPALWRVHAVHHMPTRLHMLKAGRHHVLYFLLRGLIVWAPLLLLGAPSTLVAWQFVALALTGNAAHANIDFKVPHFMHRILVTPQIHRLHHSTDAAQGNSNYGVLLPIWDMLFGTYTDPVKTPLPGVGIDGDPIPHKWLTELAWPVALKPAVQPRRPETSP